MRMHLLMTLALAAAPVYAAPAWEELEGQTSGITRSRTVIVTEIGAWKKLWTEHVAGSTQKQDLPEVDFSKEMVVGVFLGHRMSGGHSVVLELKPTQKLPPELLVSYREQAPSAGRFHLVMVTQPFALRRIPNAYSAVRFAPQGGEKNEQVSLKSADEPKPIAVKQVASLIGGFGDLSYGESSAAFDGSELRDAAASGAQPAFAAGNLPPPPGKKKALPEPPKQQEGKKLPPPPKEQEGKKLPPPPGTGKPLPQPPGVRLPRPAYPGGPLPDHDLLRGAQRTYAAWGMDYVGYWYDGEYNKISRGTVKTSPEDKGVVYVLNLDSGKYQGYIEFYYDEDSQAVYYTKTERLLSSVSRRVVVDFVDRENNPLLPWESESFTFALTGGDLELETANGAYAYDVSSSFSTTDRHTVKVSMTAGRKLKTAPDANGVSAGLRSSGGRIELVVNDKWAQYYEEENIELAFVIRWDDGSMWRRDPVVYSMTQRSPLRRGTQKSIAIDVPAAKSGKYYLESWSFRRADSVLSTGQWINKGKGNTVTR